MSRKKEETLAAEVGARLRRIRKRNGWTQKELAERLEATESQISRWENGKLLPETVWQIDICESLLVSLDEFVRGIGTVRGELNVTVTLREMLRAIEQLDVTYQNQAWESLRAILAQAREDARGAPAAAPRSIRR